MNDIEFGIDWTKMAGKLSQKYVPPVQRHAFCAYHNVGNGAFWHRRERIKGFWPDNYETHEWSDRRLRSGCNYNWVGWAGPGGCGKTTDAAVQGLE